MALSRLAVISPELFRYWAFGLGRAKWLGKLHPWTSLRDALVKAGVPPLEAPGLATNIMMASPEGRAAFKLGHSS